MLTKSGIANPLKQRKSGITNPLKQTERPQEPVIIPLPVHRTTVVATKALQSGIANPLKQIANPLKQIANPLKQIANPLKQNIALKIQNNSCCFRISYPELG